jgi:hypothetical protein
MLFAVDIDGTMAEHEPGEKSLIRYLNRELGNMQRTTIHGF